MKHTNHTFNFDRTGVDQAMEIVGYASALPAFWLPRIVYDLKAAGITIPCLTDDECYEVAKASVHPMHEIRLVFPAPPKNEDGTKMKKIVIESCAKCPYQDHKGAFGRVAYIPVCRKSDKVLPYETVSNEW